MVEELFRRDAYLKQADARVTAVEERGVRLDRSIFYPTGGGQPGDTGVLRWDGGEARVMDSVKADGGDVLHVLASDNPRPTVGTTVHTALDWERRYRHMRMHTALHVLCAVVPYGVTGGQVGDQRSRLDFDIEMERLVKADIETRVNQLVKAAHDTHARWVSDAELEARPELVKTMSVAPPLGEGRVRLVEIPGVDLQACGGTHVKNTAEIGAVQVARIRSEGKRNKRVTLVLL